MSRSPDRTHRVPDSEHSLPSLGQQPPPDMAVQQHGNSNPPPRNRLPHPIPPPSFLAASTSSGTPPAAASRYLHPVQQQDQDPRAASVSTTDPAHYFSSAPRRQSNPVTTPAATSPLNNNNNSNNNKPASLPEEPGHPGQGGLFQRPPSRQRSAFSAASPSFFPSYQQYQQQEQEQQQYHAFDASGYAPAEEHDDHSRPWRPVDTDGWIEKSLAAAKLKREALGMPDPFPMPPVYKPPPPPFGRWDHLPPSSSASERRPSTAVAHLYQYHRSSPSDFYPEPQPGQQSQPRRESSSAAYFNNYNNSTPFQSPAPSQATIGGGVVVSPPESGTGVSGVSERGLSSTRANSSAADGNGGGGEEEEQQQQQQQPEDTSATFHQIHDVPQVVLVAAEKRAPAPPPSRLEQLPQEIFMRVMMYCGYKEQVLLRAANYRLYHAVSLEAVPWTKKTETIMLEERDNPKNFPKKPPRAIEEEGDDDDEDNEDEAGRSDDAEARGGGAAGSGSGPTNRRKRKAPGGAISRPSYRPARNQGSGGGGKTKAHPDTLGRWGCYYCYKILPAHHFEGQLLEDKEGRKPKNHNTRGAAASSVGATESDRKVDMRVAYVKVVRCDPGRDMPEWLTRDTTRVEMDDESVESYVRARMARGVNCDDLRAYYRDLTREIHLVAPARGVNPVYVKSPERIPPVSYDRSSCSNNSSNTNTNIIIKLKERPESEEGNVPSGTATTTMTGTYRPLYKLLTNNAVPTRGDANSASYTYEITTPRNPTATTTTTTNNNNNWTPPDPMSMGHSTTHVAAGRIYLPGPRRQDHEMGLEETPRLAVGDVVSLRRVCIPCGAKYSVYRRQCNRKIISKTEEAWWVCGCWPCPQIRPANTSRIKACPRCNQSVIY